MTACRTGQGSILGALLAALMLVTNVTAQDASVSGFVTDSESGETLLQSNVIIRELLTGTATNLSGYYTLTGLVPAAYTLAFSYLGYQSQTIEVDLSPGQRLRLDVELRSESLVSEEIVISGERKTEEEIRRIGVTQLTTAQIKQVPALLEADVFRSLQLLPGVKAASDYSSGLYVRGGSPDQTLILLDRTTVYNPSHFFGFFSTFNPDAIKDVRLYKGAYPAEYGGRLGSVVDIYNKDGNRYETHGGVTVGLLASRINLEGPYSKGSWMIAVRRTTLEPMLAIMRNQDISGIPDSFYFYDVNGKVNFDAGTNDKLSLAVYLGRDELAVEVFDDAVLDLSYGNRTFSANWTHIFSQELFSNFTATGSRYFSEPEFDIAGTGFERVNRVYDFSVKGDFEYVPGKQSALKTGFWAGSFTMRFKDTFDDVTSLEKRIQAKYVSLYVNETWRPTRRWMVQGGLRANYFSDGNFLNIEPRFALEYRPSDIIRLQLGGGRYYQFLTLITSEVFTGFDIWLTADDGVPPMYGDQIVAGVKTILGNYNIDIEGYYRNMKSLFQLDPFLPDGSGVDYADLFHFGEGYAYGTEIAIQKPRGRLNGFLGYTLAFTRRKFPNLNAGEFFAPKYDRTHDLNVTANYELGRSWRFTSIFTYGTGQAYTEPLARYKIVDNPFGSSERNVLISPYNAARLSPYHRLDIGFSKQGRFFSIGDYELQLQVLNAYMRENVWFFFYEFDDDNTVSRETVPQIPIAIPNITFTVTF